MRVVCENNERYDYKNARWIKKKKIEMHVNPIINDAWKDWSVKKLKTEIFEVLIGQKESKT